MLDENKNKPELLSKETQPTFLFKQ